MSTRKKAKNMHMKSWHIMFLVAAALAAGMQPVKSENIKSAAASSYGGFDNYAQLTAKVQALAAAYPNLVSLQSMAVTPEGRNVWLLEIAAERSDGIPLEYRPAFVFQANLHAVEMTGSRLCLVLAEHLCANYSRDDALRSLLGKRVVYIIPRLAVDGAEYVLRTSNNSWCRSKYVDAPQKNSITPEDIDGDGKILSMRWPSPDGLCVLSTNDSRLMLTRRLTQIAGEYYYLVDEGMIHDWDGGELDTARNQSQARCDFNRDFPTANWRPYPHFLGQGKYPLSEPETRAMADFIIGHTNIVGVLDFHGGNQAIFYPTAAIKTAAEYDEDARLIALIGEKAQAMTGLPLLSSYEEIKTGKPQGETTGSYWNWCYERQGKLALVFELGMIYNYLGFNSRQAFPMFDYTSIDVIGPDFPEPLGLAMLRWHDQHPDGGVFHEWKPFDHPQLGKVEIGGFNIIGHVNPPPEERAELCAKCVAFCLEYMTWAPEIEISEASAIPITDGIYRVKAVIRNTGKLPTYITRMSASVVPHAEVNVCLKSSGAMEILQGRRETVIDPLPARIGKVELEWLARTGANNQLAVEVRSERGIYAVKPIEIAK